MSTSPKPIPKAQTQFAKKTPKLQEIENPKAQHTKTFTRGPMTKDMYLDEKDRKLLAEIKQKLDEATKLMSELIETLEVLSNKEMLKKIKQGQADIKAGRTKELHTLQKEEAL